MTACFRLGGILFAVLAWAASAHAADAVYFPSPDSEGGWREVAIDTVRLDEAFDYIQGSAKNGGLLVLRDGSLVYERYYGLGHREATPNLASVSKSFTSIAVGILMSERPELFPDGLDQQVFTPAYFPPQLFPLADPAMARIRLGQLLSFTAGIRGNNPSYVNGKQVEIDPIGPDGYQAMVDEIAFGKRDGEARGRRTTASSLWCEPGGGYSYATASIHLGSVMLRHLSGMEIKEFVRRRLAEPLGWGGWGYGYQQYREITHTPGGGGIALRATDVLRFGYLLLQQGRWGDQQIVPAEYLRHAAQASPYNPHYPYSLQFDVNNDGHVDGAPRDAFWKSGSGGHALYVVPSLDLVVWKLGGRDSQYSPADTGLPASPSPPLEGEWEATVAADVATVETLRKVVAAIQ